SGSDVCNACALYEPDDGTLPVCDDQTPCAAGHTCVNGTCRWDNWCFAPGTGPNKQPSAHVDLSITGVESGTLAKSDDPGEFVFSGGTTWTGNWSFARNTDGGAIANIELPTAVEDAEGWKICLDVNSNTLSGINNWEYFKADGDNVTLDFANQVCLQYTPPPAGYDIFSNEGDILTVCAYIGNDAGNSAGEILLDWGDSSSETHTITANVVTCYDHIYAEDGDYLISLSSPEYPLSGSVTANALVNNVDPVVTSEVIEGGEGSPVTLVVQAQDQGANDLLDIYWYQYYDPSHPIDPDNAPPADAQALGVSGGAQSIGFTYPDDIFPGGIAQKAAVVVCDDEDFCVLHVIELDIADVLNFTSTPGTSAIANQQYSYQVGTFDPGDDSVAGYQVMSGPTGLTISGTGLVTWTPGPGEGSTTPSVTIRVTDEDANFAEQTWTISVSASCDDNVLNQDESDTDCGGVCGSTCLFEDDCNDGDDCVSLSCSENTDTCLMPTCEDSVQNGNELGVDCGGGTCEGCDNGTSCNENSDCANDFCNPTTHVCATPTCEDGFENQDETDTDCGGTCGATCEVDEVCA
ncbi:MAG: hypothetical protein KC561_16365, partial [Myxococcales bacterium]|nr:hypothetical protein [Myxococcales bacterium]